MGYNDDELKSLVKRMHEYEMSKLPSKDELEETYTLSDTFYKKMERLIKRVEHKSKVRQTKGYIAAGIALVLLLISLANPEAVVKACNQVMRWFEDHANFKFSQDVGVSEISQYELTYVPQGYEVALEEYCENAGLIYYLSGDDMVLLSYGVADGSLSVNNEGVELIMLEDENGELYYFKSLSEEKDNQLVWVSEDGTVSFALFVPYSLGEEELFKVKDGIQIK